MITPGRSCCSDFVTHQISCVLTTYSSKIVMCFTLLKGRITVCHSCCIAVGFSFYRFLWRVDRTKVQMPEHPRSHSQGVVICCNENHINLAFSDSDNKQFMFCRSAHHLATVFNWTWWCQFFRHLIIKYFHICVHTMSYFCICTLLICWLWLCFFFLFVFFQGDANAMAIAEVWEWRDRTGLASKQKPYQRHVFLL